MAHENSSHILIVDDDVFTTKWLRTLLENAHYQVDTAATAHDALDHFRAQPASIIMLDRVLPDLDGLDLCRRFRTEDSGQNAWIIILSVKASHEDIVAGLRAGADDYIPKRRGADVEILEKVKAMAERPRHGENMPNIDEKEDQHGRIIAFFSAKGGSGTTTLAVNTAYAIQQLRPQAATLLADMVFPLGSVGRMLGFESAGTLAKLSREIQPTIDRKLIARYVKPDPQFGLNILLSANDLNEAQNIVVNQINPLFKTLRTMYNYIVVDFGHALSRLTLPVLEDSDLFFIIVSPDVNAIALTRVSLDYLLSLKIPRERIVIIQNRTVPRSWFTREDIEKQLNFPVMITVPYDGEQIPLATNAHVPYLARYDNMGAASTLRSLGELTVERMGLNNQ